LARIAVFQQLRPLEGAGTTETGRKLGKNSPFARKLAEFRVFLPLFGLLFFADRL
jgi:hypothetical protein